MKHLIASLAGFAFSIGFAWVVNAQSIDMIKADRVNYIWGEGSGMTLHRADQDALGMLINQISAHVQSDYVLLQQEVTSNGKTSFEETFRGVINTYSSATLRNTERIVIANEPDARVFRYIKRSDIDKIFADRERKIHDFVKNGQQARADVRPADALRYYYWALTLLRSHPKSGEITFQGGGENGGLLSTMLHKLINDVFTAISIKVTDTRTETNLQTHVLDIRYDGKPARNFDYSYWTGRDWTNIYSARDGLGVAEFFGETKVNEIRFRIEYTFEGETAIDNELRDVMKELEIIPFRNSYLTVPVSGLGSGTPPPVITGTVNTLQDTRAYDEIMGKLVNAIRTGDHRTAQSLFTAQGFEMYRELLQYGNARIIREPRFAYISFNHTVVCRAIPMSFHFSGNRSFVEDVVFHFDSNKKIASLSFGLASEALNDVFGNTAWDDHVKMVLVTFLENYKTAYALKRIDYLESIFYDEALIITGTVLTSRTMVDGRYQDNQVVRYNRQNKQQFIRNLRHSFASKEYINIRFEDNAIRKAGRGGEIYGINIKQDYFSSNYGDTGYLFLLVDVNKPEEPIIHVRTWQPGNEDVEKLIDLSDF
jgi:hypothetical protein